MALILNGNPNPDAITYNGNDLKKVIYNGSLVWSKPGVYKGGSGSGLFNVWQGHLYGTNREDVEGGRYSSYDLSNMTASMIYDTSGNLLHVGLIKFKTKESFDISLYNTATLKVNMWSERNDTGMRCTFRPTIYPAYDEAMFANNGYVTANGGYTTTPTEYTLACNLGTIKATTNAEVYFHFSFQATNYQRTDYWTYAQVKSIILS